MKEYLERMKKKSEEVVFPSTDDVVDNDYPAAGLKHARDYLKEHDPEVLDALFYTRDDSDKEA